MIINDDNNHEINNKYLNENIKKLKTEEINDIRPKYVKII